MASPLLLCPRCGQPFASAARYCLRCGEPVDPQLIAQLQMLYATLTDLDARIAQGKGAETITTLRDDYRAQYLSMRKGAPEPAAATTTATTTTAPAVATAAPPTIPLSPAASASSAPAGTFAPTPSVAPVRPIQAPIPEPASGPAFVWQAFIAEQAIAIMAYLGGFLLLVATLTFE
ncbi:MAG: zinc ribbon domain-containing protein, partial [Ktedonobacterales bacterium]